MDLRAAVGDPAYAVGAGTVEYAEHGSPTAGNWIGIRHSGGLLTRYLHLSVVGVTRGQQVAKGQLIGQTGNTGSSAAPHLHFDAELPTDKLSTYTSLFGKPPGGFGDVTSFGVKVPIEPLIPVDSYAAGITDFSKKNNLTLRGGAGRWLAVGGVAVVGVVVWKNRDKIKRRLGS
jgi:murein DD-endopeptidase MepM/ murein hydrolase activator NlpD